MLIIEREPGTVIERVNRFEPGAIQPKWIDRR
jgi:hypothetical protein